MQNAESSPALYARHIHTAALLRDHVLTPRACTIFAGVALSVDHSFSFYRSRLGLEADICPALSVVTEHHEQTLLYLPNDVPEPNMPQYQRHLDDAIVQLATILDGQFSLLFPAYPSLPSSYPPLTPFLHA